MTQFDVVTIGELLIDLVPLPSADGSMRFVAKPGGAPGNVAVGVARLGGKAAMLTKVGDEAFGRALLATLHGNGVHTDAIRITKDRRTGLAVVTLTPEGDRDFFFYRDGCADSDYTQDDLDRTVLDNTRVLHIGSLFLAQPTSAATQRFAVAQLRAAGTAVISADPNLRVHLWQDQAAMLAAGLETIKVASVVKVGEDELMMMTGTQDLTQAVGTVWHDGLNVLAVTRGPDGASIYTANDMVEVPGFKVQVVDTIGAGDSFMAMLLSELGRLDHKLSRKEDMERVALRACAAGALTTTRPGGMESLPTTAEVDAFLKDRQAA